MSVPSTYHKNLAVHMHFAQHTSALDYRGRLSKRAARLLTVLVSAALWTIILSALSIVVPVGLSLVFAP